MLHFDVLGLMHRVRLIAVVLSAGLLAGCQSSSQHAPGSATSPTGDIVLAVDDERVEGRVPRNATLETILRDHELSPELTTSLIDAVRSVFDPRRIRANQLYRLSWTLDGLFREFRYQINADSFLRVARAIEADDGLPAFAAEVVEYPREVVDDATYARITRDRSSLIAALNAEGENQLLALDLATVFSGLVDFNSELRVGDDVRVLFERVLRNGVFAGYDQVRAAVLNNDGRILTAIPFPQEDGTIGWYDENGRSLKRRFLKSPLPFQTSISSGFSYRRLHPVSGTFQAHPAIDYRAPWGSKVVSVADGTVVFAARSGASGNLVRVRHAGGYETLYLHLSSFGSGIRSGVRVAQGQTIGHVGNTGNVTGTHLDFRLKKNGAYVNPLREYQRMPPGDPIPDGLLPAFEAQRDLLLEELTGRLSGLTRRADSPN